MDSIVETIRALNVALTVPQFAKLLSMPKGSAYDLVASGSLPSYRINSSIRLDPKHTAQWLQDRFIAA